MEDLKRKFKAEYDKKHATQRGRDKYIDVIVLDAMGKIILDGTNLGTRGQWTLFLKEMLEVDDKLQPLEEGELAASRTPTASFLLLPPTYLLPPTSHLLLPTSV